MAAPIKATKEAVLIILPFDPPGLFRIASIAYLHPHMTPILAASSSPSTCQGLVRECEDSRVRDRENVHVDLEGEIKDLVLCIQYSVVLRVHDPDYRATREPTSEIESSESDLCSSSRSA